MKRGEREKRKERKSERKEGLSFSFGFGDGGVMYDTTSCFSLGYVHPTTSKSSLSFLHRVFEHTRGVYESLDGFPSLTSAY